MSVDYFLVSETESIWIAQVGFSGFTFYSGHPDCMKELAGFLEQNMGKSLRFLPEYSEELDSVTEITW